MRKSLKYLLLLLALVSSCRKDNKVIPIEKAAHSGPPVISGDTVADNAKLRIELFKDSTDFDETLLIFKKTSKLSYSPDEDVAYFQGFGQVSLSTVSSDQRNLTINGLPYSPGLTVPLNVGALADGTVSFAISYEYNMPPLLQIWLIDHYLKDSVNLSTTNYKFAIVKSDSNSFGNKRFCIKFIYKPYIQTTAPH